MNLNPLINFITSKKTSNFILAFFGLFTLTLCVISQSQKSKITKISTTIQELKKTDTDNVKKFSSKDRLNDEEIEKLINQVAKQITVLIKYNNGENIGSGVIVEVTETEVEMIETKLDDQDEKVKSQKQPFYIYRILTNDHVVDKSDIFQVKTNDNKIHSAHLESLIKFKEQDLALLLFISPHKYQKANLGDVTKLPDKSSVYAVGFPCANRPCEDKMVIKSGVLAPQSLLDGKSFVRGRNIGYSAEVIKGMSGGPIIDFNGNVIGLNSFKKHPEILFKNNNPRTLMDEDGNEIELTEEQKTYIDYFAWGVSIDFYKQLLNNNNSAEITTLSNNQETSTIPEVNDINANNKNNIYGELTKKYYLSWLITKYIPAKIIILSIFLLLFEKIYIYCHRNKTKSSKKTSRKKVHKYLKGTKTNHSNMNNNSTSPDYADNLLINHYPQNLHQTNR